LICNIGELVCWLETLPQQARKKRETIEKLERLAKFNNASMLNETQHTSRKGLIMCATIVCIHGTGGGGWEYALWQPVFNAAGYRAIANDLLPAAGGLAATRIADYLQQVQSWLPAQEPVILVGASMGGLLALKVAEQMTLATLVLVNSVPPAGVGAPRSHQPRPAIVRWANGQLEETRTALFDSDENTIQWAWPRWRDEAGAVMNAMDAGIPVQPPRCPTLVVLGELDTDIPYQTGLELATWARADVLLYHGMSHVGPLLSRRAEEVAEMVILWCQRSLRRHSIKR
jgi:pimeloyl-ACP methyl ester carboxylesterase